MPEWLQTIDEAALLWIAEHLRTPALTALLSFYTQLGNSGLLFIALAVLLLFFRSTRKGGAAALTAMFFGLIVTNLTIKPLVSRLRPWIVMENFTALVAEPDPNSFPSGHSCSAFAFAVALCIMLPKRWMKVTALCMAAVMALSRLYVGVHFPSDVVVGSLIGALCGLAGAWAVKRVIRLYQERRAAK